MYTVYGDVLSGNCYKIKLLLHFLQEAYEWQHIDILQQESRTSNFLEKNPNGKVPVLEYEPGEFLFESNAILHYLADNTDYLPSNKLEHARTLQWMFFEQYSHEPFIATSRYILLYLKGAETHKHILDEKREPGYNALGVMERHLQENDYFVANRLTIADIALFAYTHVGAEGGFELNRFPAVCDWIKRIQSQPNYVKIG
ncbi:MAG: glutathione S-transferase family protein [Pseudomonadota bacterium]